MGLLSFIFGKPVKIDHDFFGQMLFEEYKREPAKNHFECRRLFQPSGKIIEIGIDADIAGPTNIQIDFFRKIEQNYDVITRSITPLIEDEFGNWKEGFKIQDFKKEFEAVYLNIPRCTSQPIVWEIAFDSDHDRNHTFTLTMSDFEAKAILIDG